MTEPTPSLTHLDTDGSARMVDVGGKPAIRREATAEGFLRLLPSTLALIRTGTTPKGDVLAVARIAGIQAAKQTQHLIPLCHQLPLTSVSVDLAIESSGIRVTCTASTVARTGVEMEALTGASIAALALYDMCKAVDPQMEITGIRLLVKTKEPAPES